MLNIVTLFLASFAIARSDDSSPNITSVQILKNYLTNRHDQDCKPVGLTNVSMDGVVLKIVELTWYDATLTWSSAVSNLSYIALPTDLVWTPYIVLFNKAPTDEETDLYGSEVDYVVVLKNGTVYYEYPIMFTASCAIGIAMFPFDRQECSLIFSSFLLPDTDIDIYWENPTMDTSITQKHILWTLERVRLFKGSVPDCCPAGNFSNLTAEFTLTRNPNFYFLTLVIPTFIITFLNLLGTFLPSMSDGTRTERVTLGITTMLTLAVFLLLISDSLPQDSTHVPLISIYVLFHILINTVATTTECVSMHLHCKDLEGKPVPPRLVEFMLKYGKRKDDFNNRVSRPIHLVQMSRESSGKEHHGVYWADVSKGLSRVAFWVYLFIIVLGSLIIMWIYPSIAIK